MEDCNGCKYERSTDIKEHMEFCLHCKRGYLTEAEQNLHEDLYAEQEES